MNREQVDAHGVIKQMQYVRNDAAGRATCKSLAKHWAHNLSSISKREEIVKETQLNKSLSSEENFVCENVQRVESVELIDLSDQHENNAGKCWLETLMRFLSIN